MATTWFLDMEYALSAVLLSRTESRGVQIASVHDIPFPILLFKKSYKPYTIFNS